MLPSDDFPIQVSWPSAPVANDNGDLPLKQATIAQLIDAIRARVEQEPAEHRRTMGALALSLVTYKLGSAA